MAFVSSYGCGGNHGGNNRIVRSSTGGDSDTNALDVFIDYSDEGTEAKEHIELKFDPHQTPEFNAREIIDKPENKITCDRDLNKFEENHQELHDRGFFHLHVKQDKKDKELFTIQSSDNEASLEVSEPPREVNFSYDWTNLASFQESLEDLMFCSGGFIDEEGRSIKVRADLSKSENKNKFLAWLTKMVQYDLIATSATTEESDYDLFESSAKFLDCFIKSLNEGEIARENPMKNLVDELLAAVKGVFPMQEDLFDQFVDEIMDFKEKLEVEFQNALEEDVDEDEDLQRALYLLGPKIILEITGLCEQILGPNAVSSLRQHFIKQKE